MIHARCISRRYPEHMLQNKDYISWEDIECHWPERYAIGSFYLDFEACGVSGAEMELVTGYGKNNYKVFTWEVIDNSPCDLIF